MPVTIELPKEFIERHGNNAIMIDGDTWLLPSGASMKKPLAGGEPVMMEPPYAPLERLQTQRRYHSGRLAMFESAFSRCKSALLDQGNSFVWDAHRFGCAEPGNDGITSLLLLRELAKKHRDAVAALDSEIEALPEVQERRKRESELERWRQEEEQRHREFKQKVSEIEL